MASFDIFNPDSIIDSRDVIERIEELKAEWSDAVETDEETHDPDDYALSEDDWSVGLGTDGAAEMVALLELASEGKDYAPDWEYGATLVADHEFTDYAKQMAEDCGYIDEDGPMHMYIDWDKWASDARVDYSGISVNGDTYWVR